MSQADAMRSGTRTVFDVRGMDCAECARSVAVAVERLPGVESATVNFGAGTLIVEAEPNGFVDLAPRVIHAVEVAGYRAVSRTGPRQTRSAPSLWRDRRARLSVGAVLFWLGGFLAGLAWHDLGRALYLAAIIAGGSTFARPAIGALRNRRLDMNVLMSLAVAGAFFLGDWSEAAAAAALFAIGNLAQSLTLDRTRDAVAKLGQLMPDEANRLNGSREERVSVDSLVVGDVLRVRPGERFPLDATIIEGSTTVDDSLITGESIPVDKPVGAAVYAGTLNGPGTVTVEVSAPAAESTLSRVVELVEEARAGRGRSEQTIDRFAALYTPIVVVGSVALVAAGGALTGDWREWITRGLVLLVIACPCALIISTPVAIVAALGVAARRGFLVKGGAVLESIATIRAVVFDKTGTLTRGRPAVVGIVPAAGVSDSDLLQLAASVEVLSEHPLAHAVVHRAVSDGVPVQPGRDFSAVTGRGAQASVDGRSVIIGSPSWLASLGIAVDPAANADIDDAQSRGETILALAVDDRYSGFLTVADAIRPESAEVVAALHRTGIESVSMMTGDTPRTAQTVGTAVGIDRVLAGLLPADKASMVDQLRTEHGRVAMVGDGVNDGPALGRADIGFAMGLTGSDLAIETADVAILRNDLFAIPGAIDLSRRTVRIIRENIAISLAVKAIALVLTVMGVTTLWMAVAVDMGTSLIVTANALRLTRWRVPRSREHTADPTVRYDAGTGVDSGEATGLATGEACDMVPAPGSGKLIG